jgi:hypothetical protein
MRFGSCRFSAQLLRRTAILFGALSLLLRAVWFPVQAGTPGVRDTGAVVLTIEGTVEINRGGTEKWLPAKTNLTLAAGDSLRTGPRSRATVRLSDLSVLRVNEKTVLEIRAQHKAGSSLDLHSGSAYFFNRSKPSSLQFHTPLVSGAIRGTEFNLEAAADGTTTVTLLEGEVGLTNELGSLVLQSGEQATASPGKPPRKTAALQALNVIQWTLYYPAVLDVDELSLSAEAQAALKESLSAYRSGDLLAALEKFPASRPSGSSEEKIYYAALLLAVGQVDQARANLQSIKHPAAGGLETLIAAVKHETLALPTADSQKSASQLLADSYYLQSRSELKAALLAAQAAANKAPRFGFACVRVAELEFGFGHIGKAEEALERGFELSPRNAQGLALKGFLLAARNKTTAALQFFDQAIALDGALGNAWLGRGLCQIHQGSTEQGRQDLQVAAAVEPNRSDLRSYLGKAWADTWDRKHAEKELELAKQLDPNDPTPWLYSALLKEAYNRNNEAIAELEKSKELNGNRNIYRSDFLLDQDQAVRSANLARIYQDAGMFDVSVREAARAVDLDYGNYASHLFLANSYDALRDPRQVNLRYETPWLSQLLVADLLAPVGAVPLSQNVSQQEYSRLFAGDHVGLYSGTEYLSRGAWIQNASQYGNAGNSAFSFDEYYQSDPGERPNQDVSAFSFTARVKQQITPQDSVFLELGESGYRSGDVLQYYNQDAASHSLRINETQDPNLFAGYHHEWGPGVHTLVLAGRLQDEFELTDTNGIGIITTKNPSDQIVGVAQRAADIQYQSDLVAYSAEVQQILQSARQTLVLGARYQTGDIDTDSFIDRSRPVNQTVSLSLDRITAYGYYTLQVADPLQLTAGLSYDYLKYPENNEIPPVSGEETHKDQISPKAGFRWMPFDDTTFRGVYTRSLGGVFYDTSVRLEPTEIAGFNQAFRGVIPESIAGLVPGSSFETFGLAWDQKLPSRTYISLVGELLYSKGSRTVGTLDAFGPLLLDVPSGVHQDLNYRERSLTLNLNQLVGNDLAFGVSYRVSDADLEDRIPAISPAISSGFSPTANRDVSAILHQVDLYAVFNHRSGFFSKIEALWTAQSNDGYAVDLAGDNFWQFNAFVGYRFPRRIAEVQMGVLNIGNQDYHLNPLTLYSELPRSRTFFASFKFNF